MTSLQPTPAYGTLQTDTRLSLLTNNLIALEDRLNATTQRLRNSYINIFGTAPSNPEPVPTNETEAGLLAIIEETIERLNYTAVCLEVIAGAFEEESP